MADQDYPEPVNELTERELDILMLKHDEPLLTRREIAVALHLADSTVKDYIRQINQKLYTSNLREAVRQGIQLGLLGEKNVGGKGAKHNLPRSQVPTRFVGRQQELEYLAQLLSDGDISLVTVLGVPGVGKTRLALEAAREQVSNHEDGVWWVPMGALQSFGDVVTAIAEAVGHSNPDSSQDTLQSLVEYVHDKAMLLLLDNCEHLLEEAATLITTLRENTRAVRVLATSREKLILPGEVVCYVAGLAYPHEDASIEVRREYDAVNLFIEIMNQVADSSDLSTDEQSQVVRICELVDGLPLAIEMAASWSDLLPLREIADEIQRNIDFLERENLDIPARQRSLRAAFDYAWANLYPAEREVLMRLAVFQGGCSREAATAVAGASLMILRLLTNKCLLQADTELGRYTLHPITQHFAYEALEQSEQVESTRDRHAQFFAEMLHSYENGLKGSEQSSALAAIERDYGNVRAAWSHVIANQHAERANMMLESLYRFCAYRSLVSDGLQLFQIAREGFGDSTDGTIRAVWGRVLVRWLSPELDRRANFEQGLGIAREYANTSEEAYCLRMLGWLALDERRYEQAEELFRDSLALYQNLDDQYGIATLLMHLADYLMASGRLEPAVEKLRRALSIREQLQDEIGRASCLRWLAQVEYLVGNYGEARQALEQVLDLESRTGNLAGVAITLSALGMLDFLDGEFDEAEDRADAAYDLASKHNVTRGKAYALVVKALLLIVADDYESAQSELEAALRTSNNVFVEAHAKWGLALAGWGLGNFEVLKIQLHDLLDLDLTQCSIVFLRRVRVLCAALLTKKEYTQQVQLFLEGIDHDSVNSEDWDIAWTPALELRALLHQKPHENNDQLPSQPDVDLEVLRRQIHEVLKVLF